VAQWKHLGHLETLLLEVLWIGGELSVRDVAARIGRPLAYTTIMTTLDRLYKKGLLRRTKADRAFLYAPVYTREEYANRFAGEMVEDLLKQSPQSEDLLISSLVDALGQHDGRLLDRLEEKIEEKRRELRGGKS
jgi:predicted transcriptional regulator